MKRLTDSRHKYNYLSYCRRLISKEHTCLIIKVSRTSFPWPPTRHLVREGQGTRDREARQGSDAAHRGRCAAGAAPGASPSRAGSAPSGSPVVRVRRGCQCSDSLVWLSRGHCVSPLGCCDHVSQAEWLTRQTPAFSLIWSLDVRDRGAIGVGCGETSLQDCAWPPSGSAPTWPLRACRETETGVPS